MSASSSTASIDLPSTTADAGVERRRSGRRARSRDRLMDRATQTYEPSQGLVSRDLENLLLFIDDDLREAGLAIGHIEAYLVRTLDALEQRRVDRSAVHRLASDTEILDQLDVLNETVESFRRRLAKLALRLK